MASSLGPPFEVARVLVRVDHFARVITTGDDGQA